MNASGEDPIDGDQDGSLVFFNNYRGQKIHGIEFCDVRDI